jgi:hypothetical protein
MLPELEIGKPRPKSSKVPSVLPFRFNGGGEGLLLPFGRY